MKKIKIIFTILIVFSLAYFSSCSKDNNTVSGTVYKVDSTQTANNTSISIIHNNRVVEEKTTDGSGKYTFESLPEGLYYLEATIDTSYAGTSVKFYLQYKAKREGLDFIIDETSE